MRIGDRGPSNVLVVQNERDPGRRRPVPGHRAGTLRRSLSFGLRPTTADHESEGLPCPIFPLPTPCTRSRRPPLRRSA
ncbi:hypothetical protein ACIQ9D_21205 [Streptomyces anulatus]